MRIRGNLKINSLINQKAQAIVELATFGSLLLFCLALLIHFGLSMNYQQNVQMQAFRKGLKMAYYKQGPSQPSITMVKDKPVVDPRDRWGFGERMPVVGGAGVSWDPNLNGLYVGDSETEPEERDAPRVYIEVDKKMRLEDSEINDNLDNIGVGDKKAAQDKGIFTTASFEDMSLDPERELRIYVLDATGEHGQGYYCLDIKAKDIKVFEDPEDPKQHYAAYLAPDALTRRLGVVDLYPGDEKIKQVNIIAVKGSRLECDEEDKYCGMLTWIRYINPATGDINPEYIEVEPGYKDKQTDKPIEEHQGLLTNNSRKNDYGTGTKIIIKEKEKEFSTVTQSTATQTITHKIGYQTRLYGPTPSGEPLMGREVKEVPVEFKQPAESYNWKVTHE